MMLFHARFIDARQTLRGLCLAAILTVCGLPAGADESKPSPDSAAPLATAPVHAAPGSAATPAHVAPAQAAPGSAATPAHVAPAQAAPGSAAAPAHVAPVHEPVVANPELDLSGHKRLGKAS